MRTCLVSRELAPFWGGGIGTYASQMSAAWGAAGHPAHVVTLPHAGLREWGERERPGVTFHTVRVSGSEEAGLAFRRHARAVLEALRALHTISPLDYIEFPDYWAEGSAAIAAAREGGALAGATLGVRLHTPTPEARLFNAETLRGDELHALVAAENAAIMNADVIISPTYALLDLVSRRLRLGHGVRTAVVPYPFEASSVRELGGGSCDSGGDGSSAEPTVLYFGRLERRKGVEVLIQAARELLDQGSPARFRLVGGDTQTGPDGTSMRAYLDTLIEPRWRERIVFEGSRPRSELGAAVRAAVASGGVCCLPSLWENFPNTCVEAMALGAPVVASDAGGMAEIIQDGRNGLLFRSGDAHDLARVLGGVLGDAERRAGIAEAAPARIAEYCDPGSVVAAMVSAIGARQPAGAQP